MSKRKSHKKATKVVDSAEAVIGEAGEAVRGLPFVAELSETLGDVEALVNTIADSAAAGVQALGKVIGREIAAARETIDDISFTSLGDVRSLFDSARRYVRKHPWHAAALVLVVGTAAVLRREGGLQRLEAAV